MRRLNVIGKIAPEAKLIVEQRYAVLQTISLAQPVGRRSLAFMLNWPERKVRNELNFLRDERLLISDSTGVSVTPKGDDMLSELKEVIRHFRGLSDLEDQLGHRLNLKRVIIVSGDSDIDETVKREIASETARFLTEHLVDGDVLAVTGGTTLAEVATSFPQSTVDRAVTVVPARGGLGEEVELQANTVAANIAMRLGGRYRLLFVPDDLGKEAIASVSQEPKIRKMMELIRSARTVVHGIGSAEDMAKRRGLPQEAVLMLRRRRAVGEAFGYYFDNDGGIVFTTSSVGLHFEDLKHVPTVVAVGGGHSKAEAALAVLKTTYQDVVITDEGAAKEMLRRLSG